MKKLLVALLSFVLILNVVKAEGKVKVYVFEAGGCPYCELELEYLQGLDSYNEKFEIVKKQLYVDHVDWAQGKDYELGKKVAEAFQEAGFENADYKATPFVIISDLYASAGYDTNLEDYINAAYEEGDQDVVACIQTGRTDCVREHEPLTPVVEENKTKALILIGISVAALIGAVVYVFVFKNNRVEETPVVIREEVQKVPVAKKTPVKKTTAKKAPVKKTTKKK